MQMVYVKQASVAVILATLEHCAINCHAMPVVPNMDNAKMVPAFARKAGTDAIVHCVSRIEHSFINIDYMGRANYYKIAMTQVIWGTRC